MAPKHSKLQIFIVYKTFIEGIKAKNLPRTSRFGLWSFYKGVFKTTTCPRQPLLIGPKSGPLIQVWLYSYLKDFLNNVSLNNKLMSAVYMIYIQVYPLMLIFKHLGWLTNPSMVLFGGW